jgi:hypothetical protein
VVFFLNGRYLSEEENEARPDRGENSVQIGEDLYVEPIPPGRFLNHSCDPNVGLTPELEIVTLRPVAAGEELRFDYSTTMLERRWTMRCACGSWACRGVISDFDSVPIERQGYYVGRGVVQEFIVESVFGLPVESGAAA